MTEATIVVRQATEVRQAAMAAVQVLTRKAQWEAAAHIVEWLAACTASS